MAAAWPAEGLRAQAGEQGVGWPRPRRGRGEGGCVCVCVGGRGTWRTGGPEDAGEGGPPPPVWFSLLPGHFAPALGVSSSGSSGRSARLRAFLPPWRLGQRCGDHFPPPQPHGGSYPPLNPVAHPEDPYNLIAGVILLLALGPLRPEFKSAPFQLPAVYRTFPSYLIASVKWIVCPQSS